MADQWELLANKSVNSDDEMRGQKKSRARSVLAQ
jgi:hypothetical protein